MKDNMKPMKGEGKLKMNTKKNENTKKEIDERRFKEDKVEIIEPCKFFA